MDKIFITTSGDILSTCLAEILLKDNENIIYTPNVTSGENFSNIYNFLKNDNYNPIGDDVTNSKLPIVDYIYFLDCMDTDKYLENKYNFSINLINKINNFLLHTKQTGAKILFTLPFCDYRKNNKNLYEYYNLLALITNLITLFGNENKINYQITRLCDIYGKYCTINSNNTVAKIIFNTINNKEITLNNNIFHLIYANDAANILIKIMNTIKTDDIIDVASQSVYLDFDIAKLIADKLGKKNKITIKDNLKKLPEFIPNLSYLNNNNLTPKTTLSDGLDEVINYFKLAYFR